MDEGSDVTQFMVRVRTAMGGDFVFLTDVVQREEETKEQAQQRVLVDLYREAVTEGYIALEDALRMQIITDPHNRVQRIDFRYIGRDASPQIVIPIDTIGLISSFESEDILTLEQFSKILEEGKNQARESKSKIVKPSTSIISLLDREKGKGDE